MNTDLISPWFLYLWTRLDSLKSTLFLLCCLSIVVVIASLFLFINARMEEFEAYYKPTARWLYSSVAVTVLLLFLNTATPTTKDAAIIYIIPKIANNQAIQQEASDLYTIAKSALKEYLPKPTEEKK